MIILFLEFAVLATVIFFSGKRLSYYGDIIADYLGLGKAWVGLILMALVTSLPELFVGISSVSFIGSADLALGDVLGSCAFNLLLLSVMDAFVSRVPLSSKVSASNILAAALSVILIALVGLALFLPPSIVISKWIGVSSIVFVIVYFASVRLFYQYERNRVLQGSLVENKPNHLISLRKAVSYYILNAIIVVGAALFLPAVAEGIALRTGLGESFVGTLFLAASTSLPEAAVSISAIRLGAFDMAVGNLIGSNMFNVLILSIDDLFYTKGYLLKDASDINIISTFSVIIMTGVAITGLMYKTPSKRLFMAWDALVIAAIYVGNLFILYYLRGH